MLLFNFASVFFLFTRSMLSCCHRGVVVPLFCSPCQDGEFFDFFWSEIFTRFLGSKPCFRNVLLHLYLLLVIMGALKLRLPVAALSESVTRSGATRTLLNLNMSKLHFSVLVLQVSNSFDLTSLFLSRFI